MKVIIQKPDLDTCLTALILAVTERDEIVVVSEAASADDLADPEVLCIEAGGSGGGVLNNFDHHDPGKHYPTACRQAYDRAALKDEKLKRLVEYVSMVDDRRSDLQDIAFPSLSSVFSGMLLNEKDLLKQFHSGIGMLKTVLAVGLEPFATMPERQEWRRFIDAKRENHLRVRETIDRAEYHTSKGGLKVGAVESAFIGGIGALYEQGCDVVVMLNPAFGEPPVRKFTIAGNNRPVSHLLPHFNSLGKGWGGRDTIIGSPREGTSMSMSQTLNIVLENI